MTDVTYRPSLVRERRALQAGALTIGPAELVDFLLPLWAGVALGLDGTAVGVLLAVELALSVVMRPVAGLLADVRDRRRVAALGAVLYGVSCAGYALAEVTRVVGVAYGAAAVGGVGGAFLWVAVRAIVAERLAEDTGAFARLMAWQETGAWVAFVVGLSAFSAVGFRGVFLACGVACLVAAVALLTAPRRPAPDGVPASDGVPSPDGIPRTDGIPVDDGVPLADGVAATHGSVPVPAAPFTWRSGLYRRLRPMLGGVVLTTAAEAAVGLMLLLHLQRDLGLDVVATALVFLPGSIVASLAATPAHRLVLRLGRRRVIVAAAVSSALFAASLAWAPGAVVIAGAWVLMGLAYAAVIPIGQAVVTEVAGDAQVGRGMGVYAAAALLGALVGSLAGGVLYDTGSWVAACLVAAGALLAGGLVVPWAIARVGAVDVPAPADLSDPHEVLDSPRSDKS